MKQLIKRVVKKAWAATAPVRRPIARRVDARLTRLIVTAIQTSRQVAVHPSHLGSDLAPVLTPHLEASNNAFARVEYSLGAMHAKVDRYSTEVDLVLNSLVREIARLQLEVEDLREALDQATSQRPAGLSLVDGNDEAGRRMARVG